MGGTQKVNFSEIRWKITTLLDFAGKKVAEFINLTVLRLRSGGKKRQINYVIK